MHHEPAVTVASLTGAAAAAIALLIAFGIDITNDQRTALLSAVAVTAPILVGLITREKVYSPATHDAERTNPKPGEPTTSA